jgi:tRNA-dihydrouridine synthase
MVGRAAQGKPWLPGHIAQYLATGRRGFAPPLAVQLRLILSLYDEMLAHHGFIGLRHARKHLGWTLDAAAESAGAPPERLKAHRQVVLTADDPRAVRRRLVEAFDAFSGSHRAAA